MGGRTADVFISYARADEAVARRVAKALQAVGRDVWWDADLPAHRSYSEIIERNLEQASAVVVLWSKTAAKSQWVRAEADFARNAGKLVQAQVDETLPPMPFNQIQCADLRSWRGRSAHGGWSKLSDSVQALISGEPVPVAGPRKTRLWDRLDPYRWPFAAVLTLLLAAGIYFYAFGVPGEARKPVLAVLPFKSLDSRDESLVAGIWEDTRTAIGRNPQLVVLGPNTAEQLASKGEGSARRAADYLLEASVRTAGDRIRVNANLVRTKDGAQVWNQNFDRKLDDVFALQSQIAGEIEGRIRGRLAKHGGVAPEHIATSGEAYALYSDARAKIRKRDADSYPAAATQLQQVVKMDPNFAPAWAALAQVVDSIPPSQRNWEIGTPAEAYARKAIELAPNLAAAHASLAFALHLQGPVARAEVERAVALDPNDYEALLWLGNMSSNDKEALDAFTRAAKIEPLFWPAVLNKLGILQDLHDEAGIQEMIEEQKRLGTDYLATSIEINNAMSKGELGKAANIGLAYWKTGRKEGRIAIGIVLWPVLLQLGFADEANVASPAPEFASYLWRNDPKGLDIMETHHIDPKTFFAISPLTENAGRVYILSGRGATLADLYLSLKATPEEFRKLSSDNAHFLYVAPLVAVALKSSGHAAQAAALLSAAEADRTNLLKNNSPEALALLARIYAVQGRKEQALALLTSAVNRGFVPQPPVLLVDLALDPALASLKGDPRFDRLRQHIQATVARERAQVNPILMRQVIGGTT